jgi:hypothetical protein
METIAALVSPLEEDEIERILPHKTDTDLGLPPPTVHVPDPLRTWNSVIRAQRSTSFGPW